MKLPGGFKWWHLSLFGLAAYYFMSRKPAPVQFNGDPSGLRTITVQGEPPPDRLYAYRP